MSNDHLAALDGEFDLVSDKPFFAPTPSDLVDRLIGEYKLRRAQCEQLATIAAGDLGNAIHYFIEGNAGDEQLHRHLYVDRLFQLDRAVAALNSAYWSKALALTDVYEYMPQARRDEWNDSIREHTTPEFTEEAVRPTLTTLLMSRDQFFAERVDGIFRGLSGEHVTNAPEAFGKRMIISGVIDSYALTEHQRCGLISDLRCVIAKFMGRDEPKYRSSSKLVETLKGHWGEWVSIDGGALRMRRYKKGTAHLEVHPDMAWRLNCVLARLYPLAIPAAFRQRPLKRKTHEVIARPLPFAVLEVLADSGPARRLVGEAWLGKLERVENAVQIHCGNHAKTAIREAEGVLTAIGGTKAPQGWFQFDYDALPVIADVCVSGCLPDAKSHQFYPTPPKLAALAAELAGSDEGHTFLEPEAGTGDLACVLPKERTTCVEISRLHCNILRARGFNTVHADFVAWADDQWRAGVRFDRVVMNPPFSDGRATIHLEHAASLVALKGRLVAILPATLCGQDLLRGFAHAWSQVYSDEFAGTGVSVAILTADRLPS